MLADVSLPAAAVLIWLACINAAAFVMFRADKQRARKKQRRIPEKHLLAAGLLGGAAGALLAMHLYRHKTRKPKFAAGLPLLLLLQAGILLRMFLAFLPG